MTTSRSTCWSSPASSPTTAPRRSRRWRPCSACRPKRSTPTRMPGSAPWTRSATISWRVASAVHALAADAVDRVTVVHVASRRPRSARRRAAQAGGVACGYDDLPGGADALVVGTPPALHWREVQRALDGGAAALVETPLAATLDDADRLVEAAMSGARIGYAENLVHSPVVAEAVSGCRRIGQLTHLEVRFAQGRPDWGDHLTPSWGGGALLDLGVHAIAVALLAAAPARVVAVEAELASGAGLDVDDDATVSLTFDSGLRAEVRASWRGGAAPRGREGGP